MNNKQAIEAAAMHFQNILAEQLERIEKIKSNQEWADFDKIMPIRIGMLGGDGIGPYISAES